MFELMQSAPTGLGVSRRACLQVGGLSLFGLSLPALLRGEEAAVSLPDARAKNFILLWTAGGMSNMDTFDLKPDAPAEYRGEFRPIASTLPGAPVCEHLPLMSRQVQRLCQVRTIVHQGSQHAEATHWMLTGYPQVPDINAAPVGSTVYPSFGSIVAKELGWRSGMPPYVQCAGEPLVYSGAGYLASEYNALMIKRNPSDADFSVEDVSISKAIGAGRTARRRTMLARLDAWQRHAEGSVLADRSRFYEQAFDLVTSPQAKQAFDLQAEPAALRDRYGRTREGQATLLARRLIEAGVRFVTVSFDGYDTHAQNFPTLKDRLLPVLDKAWSALLDDLSERGLLESTVVLCAGEFGRTPRVNGGAGRDHYPLCNNVAFSGAGIRMGTIVGETNSRCEQVVGTAHGTLDYAATIFRLLGVDDSKELRAGDGRPIQINSGGRPIPGVLA